MQLEPSGNKLTVERPNFGSDSEHQTQAAGEMRKTLDVVGPQLVAKAFGANFVDQLTNATGHCARAPDISPAI